MIASNYQKMSIFKLCVISIACLLVLAISPLAQADLSGRLTVDNSFEAYISASDAEQGTLLVKGNNWPSIYAFVSTLTPGQDYYLHIKAADEGGVAAFLGEFAISGEHHLFSNGLSQLNTDTSNWKVSRSGWVDYVPATSYGRRGVSPWGNSGSVGSVNEDAQWIWSADSNNDNLVYFSTKISAVYTCTEPTHNAVGIRIGRGGTDTSIGTTTEALAIYSAWLAAGSPSTGLIGGNKYNVDASGEALVDRIDFGGARRVHNGTLPYPGFGAVNDQSNSDFLVHTEGKLSLAAGDYSIYVESDDGFSLVLETLVGDTVVFDRFSGSTAGASNELRFETPTGNARTGGHFTLSQDSVFTLTTVFFERGGGDFMEVSIASGLIESTTVSDYESLSHEALEGKVKFQQCFGTPPPRINHYQIIHDGQGLTCDAETVTVKACTNTYDGTCLLSNDIVTLDLKATGTVGLSERISFTGSGTVNLPYTLAETVVLSIENASTPALNPTVCFDGSITSCNLTFADAGFRFLSGSSGTSETIENQIAGDSFALRLQAVKNTDGVCEGLFSGNRSINLSQENVAPGGTSGLAFKVAEAQIAKHPTTSAITLNFGVQSIAQLPDVSYLDSGRIRLHANYNIAGIMVNGSSEPFWVSPAQLVVSAQSSALTLNGANATASATHPAGESFDFVVRALNSQGAITPNYAPGQIQVKLARTGPTLLGSIDGYLQYASSARLQSSLSANFQDVSLTPFSAGESLYGGAHYSEVGLLNVDIQDNNYAGEGIIVPGQAQNIGRFVPHHFTQAIAQNGLFNTTCGASIGFSAYSGQKNETNSSIGAISYLSNPILAITAFNKQGEVTQNYYEDSAGSANDYMKLRPQDISGAITAPRSDKTALGLDGNALPFTANMNEGTLSQQDLTALPSVVALPKGTVHYQFSPTDNFFYGRSANSKVAPFTADIEFSVATFFDNDGVGAISTSNVSPTGLEVRFGRLRLENSFGPETQNFPQEMLIEHFDGNVFVAAQDDNCSGYNPSRVSLTNISLDTSLSAVLGAAGRFTNGKTQAISLQSPGLGNQGQIGVVYDAYDWLQYDWDNDGDFDDDPFAVASFGVFRGNDRTFNWREVFND